MTFKIHTVYKIGLALIFAFTSMQALGQSAWAQDAAAEEKSEEQIAAEKEQNDFMASLTPQTGTIPLSQAYATLNLPEGYTFFDARDTEKILTDLWGNPPGQEALGSIFPPGATPYTEEGYTIVISFDRSGYVKDEDAASTNFDKLLKRMQKDTVANNKYREQEGYPKIELLGWADEPHYDSSSKTLTWAKKILFEGSFAVTLNYNVRFLGRYGVLEFNYIADKKHLEDIKSAIAAESKIAVFDTGSQYADFNPQTDAVAAHGISGLISGGGMAQTLGIVALILLFLKKGGVLIFAAFAFIAKPVRNFLNRNKDANVG